MPPKKKKSNAAYEQARKGGRPASCGVAEGQTKEVASALHQADKVQLERLIEDNRQLEPVEGILAKVARRGPFGLLGEVMRKRLFKLIPSEAILTYFVPGCLKPRRTLGLCDLQGLDMNQFHRKIFLKFRGSMGRTKFLKLQAESAEEFSRWMGVLVRYTKPTINKLHQILDLALSSDAKLRYENFPKPSATGRLEDPAAAPVEVAVNLDEAYLKTLAVEEI